VSKDGEEDKNYNRIQIGGMRMGRI